MWPRKRRSELQLYSGVGNRSDLVHHMAKREARIRNLKLSRKENEYSGTNRDQAT